ncbi:MAG: hypothetical protein LBF13_05350 [Campylobacteraceae bacterium]|jgi:hypothetical protein|nr:hypothetical protein [Campylobacteraceae bacterium]
MQNASECNFSTSDNWVILSSIEQHIKAKIEAVGTPLKDWDIQINYGIKTGLNEAFIISEEKRKELISQDPKSDEIIRPILRGRDIKRYGYEFANLYLINTHNGIKEKGVDPIDIDDYPAIKHWLDFGGIAYNGKIYEGYKQIEKRADQGDTPYNLRNCAYMEDFYKQKIAWNRIASEKLFSFVDEGIFIQDSMHFFTGNHLKYLCATLNSKLFVWLMYLIVGDAAGGNAGNADNVKNLTIHMPSLEQKQQIEKLFEMQQYGEIDKLIYELYGLAEDEIQFIESQ